MKIQLSDHFSYKRLLRFVAPSILMLLCTSVYSIVDGFFVSNYVGKTPFAALNLVMPVLMGVGTLGFMAGTGGSAVVSMTLGEGKKELANEYFSLIVYVTLAVSIVVGFICFALAPQIALALGADGELEADCVRYSRILFLSSPAFVMQYLFQSFFIAAEKPALSLKVNVIAGLTNAVLDYVLIVVFPLGLVGAALATAAGQLVGGIIPVIYFFRENGSLLQLGKTKWHGKVIWQTVTNGSSELVTNISTSIVSILYNFQLMEAAGENGVAAYGIIMYVDIIFMTLYLGYSLGSAPIVSFHYGAGNHAELKNLCRKSSADRFSDSGRTVSKNLRKLRSGVIGDDHLGISDLCHCFHGPRHERVGFLLLHSPEQRSRIRSNLFPAYLRVPDRHRADPAETDRHNRCMAVHRTGRVPGTVCDNRIPDRQEKKILLCITIQSHANCVLRMLRIVSLTEK